ncbi:hypothetical protein QYM36_008282 [Artemia franciscana]|uniref:Vesicle transport protein n=1 Tax=Artemia franciscana TaxID=6661 RepID=A0AA88IPM8_ARTSF|nr:hypothetical protein QYM36_008282 [Artemia franciscana]
MSVELNISNDFQKYLQSSKQSAGSGSVYPKKNSFQNFSSKFSFGPKAGVLDSQQESLLSSDGSSADETDTSSYIFWTRKKEQSPSLCPSLTRMQRITGFITCLFLSVFCFGFATFYIPLLVFKARKFVALYTLGSVFLMTSFIFLKGPTTFANYIFARERLLFTSVYGGSLVAIVYFSMFLQSTVFTVLLAILQVSRTSLTGYSFNFDLE